MLDHVLLLFLLIPLVAALLLLACNRSIETYYREKAVDEVAQPKALFLHVCRSMVAITFILCLALMLPFSVAEGSFESILFSLLGAVMWATVFGGLLGVIVGGAAAFGSRKNKVAAKICALVTLVFCGLSAVVF